VLTSSGDWNVLFRVATNLENLEKSGNLKVVSEKLGIIGKVRENVVCYRK